LGKKKMDEKAGARSVSISDGNLITIYIFLFTSPCTYAIPSFVQFLPPKLHRESKLLMPRVLDVVDLAAWLCQELPY
jgi:hypothetical protein